MTRAEYKRLFALWVRSGTEADFRAVIAAHKAWQGEEWARRVIM